MYSSAQTKSLDQNLDPNKTQVSIAGFIKDAENNEALIGSYVVDTCLSIGTSSNNYGYYNLIISKQPTVLSFSFIGYKTSKLTVNCKKDTIINIFLTKDNTLNEVLVKGNYNTQDAKYSGVERMDAKTINALPAIMGVPDLLKSLTLLPGVSFGNEATSGFFVRGSSSDQNLLLLDGVPLYNPYHLYGYFSVFNVDAINSATLYKGAVPAKFGGRLASVLDVQMHEGNSKRFKSKLTLGTVLTKALIEGPIIKDKTSFSITARRSMLDVYPQYMSSLISFFNGMSQASDGMDVSQYYFADYNLKVNHKLDDKNRLFMSFYRSDDYYNNQDTLLALQDEKRWVNTIISTRWNKIYSKNLFSNLSVYHSRYKYNTKKSIFYNQAESYPENSIAYVSEIMDFSGKMDFDYRFKQHRIMFGGQYINQTYKPAITTINKSSSNSNLDTTYHASINNNTVKFYLEDEYPLFDKLTLNTGLHASLYFNSNMLYPSLQPRLSLNFKPLKKVSIKASYTRMVQYTHLLSNTWSGDPSDMWVPSTQLIKPENANQLEIGISYSPKKWKFSASVYAKNMNHLIEYKEGASYFNTQSDWQSKVETGTGKVYGFEFSIKKEYGKLTGLMSYAYSKSTRQFEALNRGQTFDYTYDRPHQMSLALVYSFNKRWSISSNWVFASGQPFTVADTYLIHNLKHENLYKQYNSINNARMPNYHRLDVGLNYTKSFKQFNYSIGTGIYNAYGRSNPNYVYDSGETLYANSLMGFMPYLTISFGFNTK